MDDRKETFLVCTVGGSPEPVIAALKHWCPVRVCFVHTPETKRDIEEKIVPKVREERVDFDGGRYDLLELPDGQDVASCLERLRRLTPEIEAWLERGSEHQVVVDFTGGTKCMSASIALQASRWPCLFSYVGGTERTKDGVGVVVTGTEKIVRNANPWDALGYRAVEDFVVLFDQRAFSAAAKVASEAKMRASNPSRKREFAVLEQFANAFDAWDRFDHRGAKSELENVWKSINDFREALGASDELVHHVERDREELEKMCSASRPSRPLVLDLLANAKRRREEGRFDDAVARLYRAIEAAAQVALKERHGIENTSRTPVERIPESLRPSLAPRAVEGLVALGVQDAYALLASLGDPLGKTFQSQKLDGRESPLVARNQSILAHGFERASEEVVDKLWRAALALLGAEEASLPRFPILGKRRESER